MKLKLFISQLENEDMSHFPNSKRAVECAVDNVSLRKGTVVITLLQNSLENRCCDFAEEDCILAFINPFSLSEEKIMKTPSNIQTDLIDLNTYSLLQTSFDGFSSVPSASDVKPSVNFWRSLPCENLPELRKFDKSYVCRFETKYTCQLPFSSIKLI